jgi:hypothetical protein
LRIRLRSPQAAAASGSTAQVQNYLLKPLDFSPLSTYFINTYPAVLRVYYRFSGAALQNT